MLITVLLFLPEKLNLTSTAEVGIQVRHLLHGFGAHAVDGGPGLIGDAGNRKRRERMDEGKRVSVMSALTVWARFSKITHPEAWELKM